MSGMIRGGPRECGTVLVLVLILSTVVGILLVGAISTATLQSKTIRSDTDSIAAMGAAEGATEIAQKAMADAIASFQEPPLAGVARIGGRDIEWIAHPLGDETTRVDPDGVRMYCRPFELVSTATIDFSASSVERVVDLSSTPLFQYMIFYDRDLEILPGARMTLEGRVHANGDVYVGTNATLDIDADYFRATGEILRRRKDTGAATGGEVSVRVQGTDSREPLDPAGDSSAADWVQRALATWDGTVQSGVHGVRAAATPPRNSIQSDGYYRQSADLVVRDSAAFDGSGVSLRLPGGTITEKQMYDARERRWVDVTEIDIARLAASGAFPRNGLLYAYRTDASESRPNGIRLVRGASLPAPLTVVSENPVYVQGDYNTAEKKGAAIIADAVNLLSNAWNDRKRPGTLPVARSTRYNLAMVAGNVPTPEGGGAYSGGFENLPRFHEDWSGRTAEIHGAFASLFDSVYARAPWRMGGDVYSAPIRDWHHDPDFLDPDELPPFTPTAVFVRRVYWDDNRPIPFRPDDASLASMPDAPTYDPWLYDAGFLANVISDPNGTGSGASSRDANDSAAASGGGTTGGSGSGGLLGGLVGGVVETVGGVVGGVGGALGGGSSGSSGSGSSGSGTSGGGTSGTSQ